MTLLDKVLDALIPKRRCARQEHKICTVTLSGYEYPSSDGGVADKVVKAFDRCEVCGGVWPIRTIGRLAVFRVGLASFEIQKLRSEGWLLLKMDESDATWTHRPLPPVLSTHDMPHERLANPTDAELKELMRQAAAKMEEQRVGSHK